MNERTFCDSNVLLYLFDQDVAKKRVATDILKGGTIIHPQVICEVANVLKRRFKLDKKSVVEAVKDMMTFCDCVPATEETLKSAFKLIDRYDFQFFDAIIVAGALESDCTILYSEDMHYNLLVEKQLRILNPFL